MHEKQLGVLIFAVILAGLLLGYACMLIHKVYKLVLFTDLPMLCSIISIALALFFMLLFLIWSIVGTVTAEDNFFNSNKSDCIANIFDCLKIIFIFHAFVYDLYKWCIFLVATGGNTGKLMKVR